jgi:hypothetical protein
MKRRYGVLVEDQTDGDVIRVVIHRCVEPSVTVKVRAQKGCAKIRKKAARVINDLIAQSDVTDIIVVHDLDRNPDTKQLNDETGLRKILGECCHTHLPRLICIPVE